MAKLRKLKAESLSYLNFVLLILAGVTIATLTGANGILTRASEASEQTQKEGLKEEIELAVGSNNIGDQVDGSGNLEEELNRINGATVSKIAEDTYYVERNGNGYTVYEDGTIEEGKVDVWDGTTIEKPEVDEQGNWHIYTTGQMKFFANYCNDVLTEEEKTEANMPEITETTTVYLENNLDMGARQENGKLVSGTQWTPIMMSNGTFDGKEHYITGIYVQNNSKYTAVFAQAPYIFNLSIKDSYIESSDQIVGGIVGLISYEINNCHNIKTTVKSSMYDSFVGGIVGSTFFGNIKNCTNSGNIIGRRGVAGIIGGTTFGGNIIDNCMNSGKIIGDTGLGGIAGKVTEGSSIKNSYNNGEILGAVEQIGGIVGLTSGTGTIENNYNKGTVRGVTQVGGIIGENAATFVVTKCYNKGTVEGTTNVGSIIGEQLNGNDNLSKLYYLSTLNLGGVNGEDIADKVIGVSDDINSYEDFLTWIESK